jgi:hypothetical protein
LFVISLFETLLVVLLTSFDVVLFSVFFSSCFVLYVLHGFLGSGSVGSQFLKFFGAFEIFCAVGLPSGPGLELE